MAFGNKQILFHPGNCLNLKKPYARECRECVLICPHQAISEKKDIALDKCTECGACMAVCPSDGMVDRDMNNLGEYILESGQLILNCPLAEPWGYEIACLGMLDRDGWSTLFLQARMKEVKLLTGDCGACEDKAACRLSVAVLKELLQVQTEQPNIRIEIRSSSGDEEAGANYGANRALEKAVSKEDAGWRQKGQQKLKALLPGIEAEETYDLPKTRQWLAEALKKQPDHKTVFKALKARDNCTGCGVCTKICPQQALTLNDKEEKKALIYEPLNCVQCSRCVDVCGPKSLTLEYVSLSSKQLTGKILLLETVPVFCTSCGKQIFHKKEPSLCLACASKDPSLKGVLY